MECGMPKGIFRLTREYLVQVILLCNKQDMLFEELATPKRTTYSYDDAVNELLER